MSTYSKWLWWLKSLPQSVTQSELQYEAWGREGRHSSLQGCIVVTVLLYLHRVLRAIRTHVNICTHTHLINAQTQQPSSLHIISQSGAWIKFRISVAFSGPQVSHSVFNLCPRMRAKQGWHISILFLSPVCMVCRLGLDRACVASGCRSTGTMGRWEQQWCQTPWERNTQSDLGTARPICLRCWSPRPAWCSHAWYKS